MRVLLFYSRTICAVCVFPQYFSNDNNIAVTIEGYAVGGTFWFIFFESNKLHLGCKDLFLFSKMDCRETHLLAGAFPCSVLLLTILSQSNTNPFEMLGRYSRWISKSDSYIIAKACLLARLLHLFSDLEVVPEFHSI